MEGIKVLIVGPSGVGKTTLKKVFFDQDNPIKLLSESLEPTYGVDTNLYDYGSKIAVVDLAGQQLEEFLTKSVEVFEGSDLILVVLDCREEWEKNNTLWKRIDEIRKIQCPEAFLTIFFHKCDLLSPQKRLDFDQKLNSLFAGKQNIVALLTSIAPEFYAETFQNFVSVLQKCLFRVERSIPKDFFIKMNIINHFIEKNIVTFAELASKVGVSAEELQKSLVDLETKGYLIFKDALKQVQLSEIGQSIVQNIKENLFMKIQESLDTPIEFIKALILSDKIGRVILYFESEPDFIKKMAGNVEYNPDPTLISMFFSAIGNFGESFDPSGFSSMLLYGKNLQFQSVTFGDLVGIFFIQNLKVDKPVENSLRQFLNEIYAEFRSEIQDFIGKGSLAELNRIQDTLVQKIKNLNGILQNLALLKYQISKDKLGLLYQKIQRKDLSVADLKNLKALLFHYLIGEDPSIMNDLFTILKGANLKDLLK